LEFRELVFLLKTVYDTALDDRLGSMKL